VPSHSSDRTSSSGAAASVLSRGAAPVTATHALASRYAAGNGVDPTMTPVPNSRATPTDPEDVVGNAPSVSGAYIYGFDSVGNPTLTDAGYYCSSDGKLPD
jgi:hypothetical protein